MTAEKMDNAKVNVFNYFSLPDGKTNADHYKMERDIWLPVHSERVKEGSMKGWVMLDLVLTMGNTQPYSLATVDIYTDMEQMLMPFIGKYFGKVHSGKKMEDIWAKTDAVTEGRYVEVRMELDSTN